MTINNEPNLNPDLLNSPDKNALGGEPSLPLENPNIGDLLINNALERQARAKITKGPALKTRMEELIKDPNHK